MSLYDHTIHGMTYYNNNYPIFTPYGFNRNTVVISSLSTDSIDHRFNNSYFEPEKSQRLLVDLPKENISKIYQNVPNNISLKTLHGMTYYNNNYPIFTPYGFIPNTDISSQSNDSIDHYFNDSYFKPDEPQNTQKKLLVDLPKEDKKEY
jgi:hypothetical protein